MNDERIDLDGKNISDDPAMGRVIELQSKLKEARREIAAIKKDRDQLLSEFIDIRNARPVPHAPSKKRRKAQLDTVRVVFGDLHGMRMDRQAVDALIKDIRTLDPDQIVMLGDMIECGGWLAKHMVVGYVALSDYSYQEDVKAANWFLDTLQKAAPHASMIILEGNHEQRIERWAVDQTRSHGRDSDMLIAAFGPANALRLEDRNIRYVRRQDRIEKNYPQGWIKIGKMAFVHELGAGKNAARAAVGQTAGNVTFGHTHRADVMPIRYPGHGIVTGFSPGCLCELQPMWNHTKPTEWTHGYDIHIVAKSGRFQHIHVPIQNGISLGGEMVKRFKT